MKQQLIKWASIFIPLSIGISIIYYQFSTLTTQELQNIKLSFERANYYYIFLSLVIALISLWSRAYRWKFALNHLGYYPKIQNNFFIVCVSYFVNLTVPRSGEISRAALLKKYENVPFDIAFGTIVAERIIDMVIFLLFVLFGFIAQYDVLYKFLVNNNVSITTIFVFLFIGFTLFILAILIWLYSDWKLIKFFKNKLHGVFEGLQSIVKMKKKGYYLLHSFFIWTCYLAMFYVVFLALPETENVTFDIVLMGFIFGSLAIGFTNGGLGAYPFSVALIFSLYGISNEVGIAFGWLAWTSQTVLTIFLGILSVLLLPILNKSK